MEREKRKELRWNKKRKELIRKEKGGMSEDRMTRVW